MEDYKNKFFTTEMVYFVFRHFFQHFVKVLFLAKYVNMKIYQKALTLSYLFRFSNQNLYYLLYLFFKSGIKVTFFIIIAK